MPNRCVAAGCGNMPSDSVSLLRFPNAQCTPTDWQSAVGDIANCRLRIGVRR